MKNQRTLSKDLNSYLLDQLDSKGGRTELSEFVDNIVQDIKRENLEVETPLDPKAWLLSLIQVCQSEGWINCYSLRGENEIEPCAVSDNEFNPKHIDITYLGKLWLQGFQEKPSIPRVTQGWVITVTPITANPDIAQPARRKRKQQTIELSSLLSKKRDKTPENPTISQVAEYIAGRQGQTVFREGLIAKFQARCCVTGCQIKEILEAAHIDPYSENQSHEWSNGLILRCDVHTLFDLHLLTIDMINVFSGHVLMHSLLRPQPMLPQEDIFGHYAGLHLVMVELPDLGIAIENENRKNGINRHMEKCFELYAKEQFAI